MVLLIRSAWTFPFVRYDVAVMCLNPSSALIVSKDFLTSCTPLSVWTHVGMPY